MAGELSGKTILLVDDDRDILAALQLALEDSGAAILTAGDGNDAIAHVEQSAPDLVVLDQMLPKRSGLLVMEKLKRDRNQPSDPPRVIMITGNRGVRHKTYAENLGVDRYFNKPFRMEKLVESVKELIG